MRSIETEYKETKMKAAVNLYQNRDSAMKLVRDFEECAESVGHQAVTMEAVAYAKEYGLQPTCPALAQTKYLSRHDAVLKVLFFDIIFDMDLIDTVPPWYSPIKPQSVYETTKVEAYWDLPVYGE